MTAGVYLLYLKTDKEVLTRKILCFTISRPEIYGGWADLG